MEEMAARLRKLRDKARDGRLFALAAAAEVALLDPSDLDNQINVVGALHESGKLRNSLLPYWTAWRSDESEWVKRAAERLVDGDCDYWALASLLGCSGAACVAAFENLGLTVRYVYPLAPFIRPDKTVSVLARHVGVSSTWAPVVEVSSGAEDGVVTDAIRFRALIWYPPDSPSAKGGACGGGSYFMRASLPYGAWRVLEQDVDPSWGLAGAREQSSHLYQRHNAACCRRPWLR